jgi:hypothetical protein
VDDFKYPQQFPGWVDKYKVQMQYKGFRHALISTRNNYSKDSIISNYRVSRQPSEKDLTYMG